MRIPRLIVACILSGLCAFAAVYISANLHPRFEHRSESIEREFAVLEGRDFLLDGTPAYFPEFQNRILFGVMLKGLSRFSFLQPSEWYLLLRIGIAFFAFLAFLYSVNQSNKTSAAGMLVLLYTLLFAFNHGWEHPSDFLDIFFMSLFLLLTLSKGRLLLSAIVLLACLNRESAVFAGLVWLFVWGVKERKVIYREVVFGCLLFLGAYAIVVLVRFWLGGVRGIERTQTFNPPHYWRLFIKPILEHPQPFSWPVLFIAMFALPVLWIWSNKGRLESPDRRLLICSAVIALASITFASMNELRIFIPSATLLVAVATRLETLNPSDRESF